MAKTASLYRCLAREAAGPGPLLARLNDELCETATRGMFVTMLAGIYDSEQGTVQLANAGHEPALLHGHDGSFESFGATAPPIGILSDTHFPEEEVELAGGTLYVCSDGLTEAACADGEELGSAGFMRLVERFEAKPPAERVDAIAAEAERYDLRDDLTLLLVSDAER